MAKQKTKKRRWWIWALFGLLLVLIGLAAYKSSTQKKGIAVEFEKVSQNDIVEKVSASGKIFPETEVKISSDVSGEIVELFVQEGDSVKAGQVLARIDAETYQSAVERGRASLEGAKTQYGSAQSTIVTNEAQRDQLKAQLKNATREFDRNKQLFEEGVISASAYEASEATVEQLKANIRSVEANIAGARKNAEGASYQVQSSKATLEELQTSLSRTTLTSPIDGVVSKLNVEKGERVVGTMQMSGTELMRIANMHNMEVQVEVSENDIVRVSEGDSVDIEVDAYLDQLFYGVVTEIASTASGVSVGGQVALTSDQVTNFVVKVRIDPKSYAAVVKDLEQFPFRPGMSASVDIITNIKKGVLSVPIQAVTTRELDEDDEDSDDYIEVVFVHQGDTVKMMEVKTGIQDDDVIEVVSGLELGQEIIKGPYSAVAKKLDEGDQVHEKKKEKDDKEDDDED